MPATEAVQRILNPPHKGIIPVDTPELVPEQGYGPNRNLYGPPMMLLVSTGHIVSVFMP